MDYKAFEAYRNENVVRNYDRERFTGVKGRLTDKMEKYLVCAALEYAGIRPPSTVLDIPCGTGRVAICLAKKGYNVRGADLSPSMVEQTRKRSSLENLAGLVTAETGNAESLPYPDNSFDACVSLRLLGHTPPEARIRILRELNRVVKYRLILAYYHKNCLQYLFRKQSRSARGIEWHPVTFSRIEGELIAAGLKKIKYMPLLPGISETVVVLAEKA